MEWFFKEHLQWYMSRIPGHRGFEGPLVEVHRNPGMLELRNPPMAVHSQCGTG